MLRENLPAKAREDGVYVMERLNALKGRFPIIGEVRGMGLMIGIELVGDDGLTPAAEQAEAVRDACLRMGVLVGVGAAYGNVVRIQPPLVITRGQIYSALDVLEQALAEVAGGGSSYAAEPVTAQAAG